MVGLKWRLFAGVYAKCLKHGQFYLSMRFPRVKKCQYFIKLFSDVHDVIWPNDQGEQLRPEAPAHKQEKGSNNE